MKKQLLASAAALLISSVVTASDIELFNGYLSVKDYTSTSDINSLDDGNVVLLKSYWGGYLKDDNGTVKTQANFNEESQVWIVEENENGFGKMFKNKETGNYLKMESYGPLAGPITGSGDAGSFVSGGQIVEGISTFDYRPVYNYMESYKYSGKCIKASDIEDDTLSSANCGYLNSSWRFEVLAEFDETIEEGADSCGNADGQLEVCDDGVGLDTDTI